MPKTPLTDLDKEVGARLKMAREALELPAVFIADEIEVTHDRIANYETGRTKLPWDVALHLFNQFRRISIPWLGEGIEPILVRDNKAPLLTVKKGVYPFYSRMPFHEVYKALWSDEIGSINSTSAWKAQTSKDDMFLALDQRVSMFQEARKDGATLDFFEQWELRVLLLDVIDRGLDELSKEDLIEEILKRTTLDEL